MLKGPCSDWKSAEAGHELWDSPGLTALSEVLQRKESVLDLPQVLDYSGIKKKH